MADSSSSFVHLHVHTSYSVKDSIVRIKDLAKKTAELSMPAAAMTDHGNLFGAVEFYQNMTKLGVKPIFGCEIYLAPSQLTQKKDLPGRKRSTHLTLLAKNETGWKNLTKLISVGHLDGDYIGEPRVDRETIREFAEGIICLSGCSQGPIHEWLDVGDMDNARAEVETLINIFGKEDLYIELMDHELESQSRNIPHLLNFAEEFGLKVVATNDVHFLEKEDHEALDCLICIGEGCLLLDENRKSYSDQVYFKSAEEMRELFKDIPGACDTTLEIAEKCNVELVLDPTSSEKYPQFDSPDGSPREEYFRRVCYEGLEKRYPEKRLKQLAEQYGYSEEEQLKELHTRLDYEIGTINDLGFASYFLITADFINWGRDQDIPVGPGRGSAAGSLVAYTMGITDICPMRFGLLFERFLNPERVSPPDVDIDFCQTRRPEVIQYVREKYGERCVAHIITYGTLGAKSVIRDVARVMGVSYGDADTLAKLIEAVPGVTLQSEWDAKEELRNTVEASSTFTELWQFATKLEGLTRNTGVHAAGVVIGDGDLDRHVPLARAKEGEVVTQADMNAITEIGLLKMDFLGLKNLTVIQDAIYHIHKHTPDFDIYDIELDDKPTLELLNRGQTMGVFQLESGGMVETCKKYGIDKIEDIIDLLALYRPGAMQFIDQMIDVKKGITKVEYEHPLLETICGDTYGVMIYQEQVQNAAKLLAGYTLGGADILRRAMGKKKASVMDEQRKTFVKGCEKTNQIPAETANKIFDKIASFAGYGFNKSHSACYGYISYWTAYLKANFPVEFISGLLSNELNNTEKIAVFISECHRMGLEVLPPDLNRSMLKFAPEETPSGKMAIRYGLAAVKNVGEAAMTAAIKDREQNGHFESMEDLSNRLDTKVVNKRILENLIKAGALDFTGINRATLTNKIEQVIASASLAHKDKAAGQGSMFDSMDFEAPPAAAENDYSPEWSKDQRLDDEKTLLGYYTSGHPLDAVRSLLNNERLTKINMIEDLDIRDRKIRRVLGGMIKTVEHRTTKAGKPFGIITIEDLTGVRELLTWSESYTPALEEGLLEPGSVVKMSINVQEDDRGEQRRVSGSQIKPLTTKRSVSKSPGLHLNLWTSRHSQDDLDYILNTIQKYPGKSAVTITIQNTLGSRTQLSLPDKLKVRLNKDMSRELERFIN